MVVGCLPDPSSPYADRSYFDRVLPAGWTLSSINEAVGNTPTEPQYANVTKHPKWAIPWMGETPGWGYACVGWEISEVAPVYVWARRYGILQDGRVKICAVDLEDK